MIFRYQKTQAAAIISEHFRVLNLHPGEDVLVSGRASGRQMVEIYRLLTGEMPQSPGIEDVYETGETPAVEWSTPVERNPNELFYVQPGFGGDPDILIKGDQNGASKESKNHQVESFQAKALAPGKKGEDQGEQ